MLLPLLRVLHVITGCHDITRELNDGLLSKANPNVAFGSFSDGQDYESCRSSPMHMAGQVNAVTQLSKHRRKDERCHGVFHPWHGRDFLPHEMDTFRCGGIHTQH